MAQQRPALTKGRESDIKELYKKLRLPYVGPDSASTWVSYVAATDSTAGHYVPYNPTSGKVPNCYGMTAKDAIALLHEAGYRVKLSGYGKVRSQSPQANQAAKKGSVVLIELR